MHQKIHELTQAALLSALVGMFILINRQFADLFQYALIFILPLISMYYSSRYGFKKSGMLLGTSFVLIFLFSNIFGLYYYGMQLVTGAIMGALIYHRKPTTWIVYSGMLIQLFVEVLGVTLLASLAGFDFMNEVYKLIAFFKQFVHIQIPFSFAQVVLIGSVCLTAILQGYLIYYFGKILLHRFRIEIAPFQLYPVAPRYGYLGLVWVLGILVWMDSTNFLGKIALAIGLTFLVYFVFWGIKVVLVLLERYSQLPKRVCVLIGMIGLIWLFYVYAGLGFFYIIRQWYLKGV